MNKFTMLYLKLIGVAACWGGTFVAGRVLATQWPHLLSAGLRFLIAFILLAGMMLIKHAIPHYEKTLAGRAQRRQDFINTLLLGLTGIWGYNIFFFGALGEIAASRTALIIAMNPIVTALMMAALYRERLAAWRWCGIGAALIGAIIVISHGDWQQLWQHGISHGELLMFCGVILWALYTVIGRRTLQSLTPLQSTTMASGWGTLLLLLSSLIWESGQYNQLSLTWPIANAILYLGVFGTVIAFIWYYEGVTAIGPARTAVFTNFVPVFGVTFGILLLNEPFYWSMILGGGLVMLGVSMTNQLLQNPWRSTQNTTAS